jgi:hypothetical protein
MQGREDRGALDATGVASFLRVADVELGGACRRDRQAGWAFKLKNDRGGVPARTPAGADHRSRSHGQAVPCVLELVVIIWRVYHGPEVTLRWARARASPSQPGPAAADRSPAAIRPV